MNFRRDIQILRGLSILLVLCFHMELPGIQSGFLGVDIFFVISGFLMAVLYTSTAKKQFFIRRARRLLPAYFTVVGATLLAVFFLTTYNELRQAASQAWYAGLFLPNLGYWAKQAYFSKNDFTPLLHLWSLGVEIQFYLLVPLLVWWFKKHRICLPLTALASLAACFFLLTISPKTPFFLTPFRLWQFLLGFATAKYFTRRGNIIRPEMGWAGLVGLVILLAIPLMPVNGKSFSILDGHPGLYALVVSLATAAILAFGLPGRLETSRTGRLLSILGNYSYSIYLVHFPIIVICLSSPFSGTVLHPEGPGQTLTIMAAITMASLALHHGVEKKGKAIAMGKFMFWVPALCLGVAMVLPALKLSTMSPKLRMVFEAPTDKGYWRCGKIRRLKNPGAPILKLSQDIENPAQRVLLVGNSHADSIKPIFIEAANSQNTDLFFVVANNPLMAGGMSPEKLMAAARDERINTIILHYFPYSIPAHGVKRLARLAQMEGMKVVFIDPVPIWEENIPRAVYEHIEQGHPLPTQSREAYLEHNREFFRELDGIPEENFSRVSIVDHFWNPVRNSFAIVSPQGRPLYFDDDHLTITGARRLTDLFNAIIGENQ
ncbi:MAG: acyltransferase [Desulfobacterales bacterium]|nr:acyltransferase [Desulfobacterales bacterium]